MGLKMARSIRSHKEFMKTQKQFKSNSEKRAALTREILKRRKVGKPTKRLENERDEVTREANNAWRRMETYRKKK